jgi:hypothetical protein
MILSTHGFLASSGGVAIDADAQAFFDRVTTAGGSLTNTEKSAVNTLVIALKANSLWTPMKAIYPMVGASAAACAQNLKSSSFTGTFTSTGWTFASTGVTPNGTSAYLNTALVPSIQLTGTSTHLSYYSRTTSTTGLEIGSWNTFYVTGSELVLNRSNNTHAYVNSSGVNIDKVNPSTQDSQAFFIASRTAINLLKMYRNASLLATNSNTATIGLSGFNTYIGASNDYGTAGSFSNKQCAFASIGDGLTDTQASNLYTAVQAFQTTLSRQV